MLLNQAIIQAALHHGYARNCEPVMTPFFMRQDIMAECAQLEQFDEELYKVTGEHQIYQLLMSYVCSSACLQDLMSVWSMIG